MLVLSLRLIQSSGPMRLNPTLLPEDRNKRNFQTVVFLLLQWIMMDNIKSKNTNYIYAYVKLMLLHYLPSAFSLEAVHPDAYQAFQTSRDLDAVLSKAAVKTEDGNSSPTKKTALKITASLMTPVLPMLVRFIDYLEIFMIYPEDGGRRFLQNISIYLPKCMASCSKRLRS
jgi:hypothetical protein